MKITLFDVPAVPMRLSTDMLKTATAFLIENTPQVVLPYSDIVELGKSIRRYSSTPLSRICQNLIGEDKLDTFVFLNTAFVRKNTPEALTVKDIVVDGASVPNINIPIWLKKCWIDIAPIASKDLYNGVPAITDLTVFTSDIVRAALVTGYTDSKIWLPPRLSSMVIESYSTTVAEVLARYYSLDHEEMMFVQTLYATYFAQLLGGENTDMVRPPLLSRCSFLGSIAEINARLAKVEHLRPTPDALMTPELIATMLAKEGPFRMNKFNVVQFYRFLASNSIDSLTMIIALQYPPYWVYQMLRTESGIKNLTLMNTIKTRNMKRLMQEFCTELQTRDYITNINRSTRGRI